MKDRIQNRLETLSVGCVATLWDLLVYRVSQTRWIVGHNSFNMSDASLTIDDAVAKFERLLD